MIEIVDGKIVVSLYVSISFSGTVVNSHYWGVNITAFRHYQLSV